MGCFRKRSLLIILMSGLVAAFCSSAQAKTTVSLDGTTIIFTVPIVIYVPVEVEPLGEDERSKLRDRIRDEVKGAEALEQSYWSFSGYTAPVVADMDFGSEEISLFFAQLSTKYRNCYRLSVVIQPTIRFQSDEGLPGPQDHMLRYDPSQTSATTIWDNRGDDPYTRGIWGSWNPRADAISTRLMFDLSALLGLHGAFAQEFGSLFVAEELGKRGEEELLKQGIELAECACICLKVTSRTTTGEIIRHRFKIWVAPSGKLNRISGHGHGTEYGRAPNWWSNGLHVIKVTGTQRRRTLRLAIEKWSHYDTARGPVDHHTTGKREFGPLDENGYYYHRHVETSGVATIETITKIRRCSQGGHADCQ